MELQIGIANAIASLAVIAPKKDTAAQLELIQINVIGGKLIAYSTDRFTAARYVRDGDFGENATYYLNAAAVKLIKSVKRNKWQTLDLSATETGTRVSVDGQTVDVPNPAGRYPELDKIFDLSTCRDATESPAYNLELIARAAKLETPHEKITQWKLRITERDGFGFKKGTIVPGPTELTPLRQNGVDFFTVLQMPLKG